MDEIIAVIQEKKNQYRIVFQHHDPLIVSDDVIVRHRLMKGKTFERDELDVLILAVQEDCAIQQAYNYISHQLRSEYEVRCYLAENNHPLQVIERVIQRLNELKLIDDIHYAESFMRTKMREGQYGPRFIVQKLIDKGISQDIATNSQEVYTKEYYDKNLIHLIEKYKQRYRNKTPKEQRQKISQLLYQKGFYSEDIQAALSEASFDMDEEHLFNLLSKQGEKYLRKYRSKPWWEQKQKIKTNLYQKGYPTELINRFLDEVEYDISE